MSSVSSGAHQAESRMVMEYSQAFKCVFGLEVSNETIQGLTLRTGRTGSLRCAVSRAIRRASMQAPKGERAPLERALRAHAARLEKDLYSAVLGHRGGSCSIELAAAQEADLSI